MVRGWSVVLIVVLALVVAGGAPAFAQTLGGQAATMEIQQELQSGKSKPDGPDAPETVRGQDANAQPDAKPSEGDWPEVNLNPSGKGGAHGIDRGPGGYVNWIKLLACWLLFLLWVKTTDWVNQDCYRHRLSYALWNPIVFVPFLVAFILMWVLPAFAIAFPLMAVAYLAPLIVFVVVRNGQVEQHHRVMTPDHIRYLFATTLNKLGAKIEVEKRADHEKGAQVDLEARGGASDRDNSANLLTARQSPGYVLIKNLIADAIDWRADAVRMDFTDTTATIRYQIDGLWRDSDALQREAADVVVAVLKTLCNLDINERAKRQVGVFGAKYEGTSYNCRLLSQQAQSGERTTIRLETNKQPFTTLEELAMRDKLAEQLMEFIGSDKGLVLLSALPEGGLTTTTDVALNETDRLMRNFVSVEPATALERDIENVEVTTYQPAKGETPATVLPGLIRTYPDVIVVRNLTDTETANILCQQVQENRLIISSLRAKEAPEALLRVLMLKVPAKVLAPAVTAVLNQRLIRRLCDECKIEYEPTPDMLQKLGIPAGRIQTLCREPTPDEQDKPCRKCRGLGYYGRSSLFELLVVDDNVRQMLLNQPNLTKAKQAARAAGMRSLQEEGILLVAKGVTSIAELTRVLKK